MLKFKKLMALTMGTLMGASIVLTGCSTSKSANGESGKNSQPVELVWYTIGAPQKDTEKVNEEINKYIKDKIGATVKIKQIDWGDYSKKMQIVVNSGEEYDIAFTCSWANDYLSNARKGAFIALNDPKNNLLDKYAKDTYNAVDPGFWEGAKLDGKIYAVPTNKELGVAPMWVFTKEYVDKYKIDISKIKNLEDLEPYLKIIKEKEPDVVPFYITKDYSVPNYFDKPIDSTPVGIGLDDSSLKVVNTFETDKVKKQLETMNKYYKAGYINKDAATAKDEKTVKRFVTKGDGQPYADVLWSKDLGYQVVATPIMDTYITNGSTTGAMQAISVTSKHPDKAMQFLNLLNTDKTLRNLVNYGIEGVHYQKAGDNQIKILPDQKNYQMPYFSLGNLFITYTLDNEPKTKWDEFKKFNAESKKSSSLGFKFDPAPVNTEVAGLKNVLDEFSPSLYSGTVDPNEYLPKLNAKLKSSGIDKIITEMQKQVDDWKSKNK
ncbi:ABC transporter substrate-binding protein [Clostridium sp. YIM B02515]|uniref:ABC transporter substrate-binding protein n=1 Tax=Clostridium rhizosphaerae TaxID=2803861 RepID=A0ABS1TE33_9CLOT|nr:ABC transporter substrate-binding protein [Clostridium rhizosphaerae]MBL4936233.1 ABC transporter substrate-binding protein [Clostridium rhizosphaerae]